MNRLEEILSNHIEGGPGAWKKLYDDIEEYTLQCIKQSLKKASENAKSYSTIPRSYIGGTAVDKESITNENNIVLL